MPKKPTTSVTDGTAPEKKARVIDPGIAAINEKKRAEVAAYRATQASAATLKNIIEKLLPKLTGDDSAKLWSALGALQKP